MIDRTEFVVLLDRSGSMNTGRDDHQGGLRSFIRDQRRLVGDTRLTLVMFDDHDPCEIVLDDAPLHTVEEEKIELIPRGCTPLLDAVGRTISHVEERQRRFKPDMTIMMIITDGMENASKEWKKQTIKELITQKETEGWKVLYLGANVDEFAEGGGMGVSPSTSMGYAATPQGIAATYTSMSSGVACARESFQMSTGKGMSAGISATNALSSIEFTDEQREWSKTGMSPTADEEEE